MKTVIRCFVWACLMAGFGLVVCTTAWARELTVVSFGGSLQDAIRNAFIQPYERETGSKVKEDVYDGALSKIAVQVKTGAISWDVVDVESNVIKQGCEEKVFEPLDWSLIGDKSQFIKPAVDHTECGLGFLTGAIVLTYDGNKIATGPKTWAEFWDVGKFPGRRGMRFSPKWTLELSLMADGVPPGEVYKVLRAPGGVDRAFKKLDALKPYISWWKLGAEAIQLVSSGEVSMAAAYSGRVVAANQAEKKNLKMVWDAGAMYFLDYLAIVKNTPNKAEAMKFIAFASQARNQQNFPKYVAYGPTNLKAYDLISAAIKEDLPTAERLARSVVRDDEFWLQYGDSLEERFNVWAAKQ
jgi:putative spermidine/putrescine transport system substrate-binding protein